MRAGVRAGLLAAALAACVGVTPVDDRTAPWTPGSSLRPAAAPTASSALRPAAAAVSPKRAAGEEIVVAGRPVPVGTRVVLWTEPGGYSAYGAPGGRGGARSFEPGRPGEAGGTARTRDEAGVLAAVDQLVLHYDACGLSRVCFEILEQRGLSVHFLLDLDGTLYQTLDLADTAWHARQANGRSIGVEIANIGAYPPGPSELDRWYGRDAGGIRVTLPASVGPAGVRTPGFTARPARPGRVRGVVHGVLLEQHDFTPEQYEALARLSAALVRTFPDLDLRVPADAQGRIRADALGAGEYARFSGILGHQHVTSDKSDPGPAFDWVRFARRTRELAAGPRR